MHANSKCKAVGVCLVRGRSSKQCRETAQCNQRSFVWESDSVLGCMSEFALQNASVMSACKNAWQATSAALSAGWTCRLHGYFLPGPVKSRYDHPCHHKVAVWPVFFHWKLCRVHLTYPNALLGLATTYSGVVGGESTLFCYSCVLIAETDSASWAQNFSDSRHGN